MLFTGDFDFAGFSGTAKFGKKYVWTARPSAFRFKYKASIGNIDKTGSHDDLGEFLKGQPDTARVYAVVVDWTGQHGVTSGMNKPENVWDPVKNDVEGILGYASVNITETTEDFVEVEVPFEWYDTVKKPAEDNYSIVISCTTSFRGDYMTGCSTNWLVLDNFCWVY